MKVKVMVQIGNHWEYAYPKDGKVVYSNAPVVFTCETTIAWVTLIALKDPCVNRVELVKV